MSLITTWEALTTVMGEVEGVKRAFDRPQLTVNEFPAVMPAPGNGRISPNGGPVGARSRTDNVRIWLLMVPTRNANVGEAFVSIQDLTERVMDALIKAWESAPRHPALRYIRRIDEITYSTEAPLTVGDATFYGTEYIVTVQEETRVQ